MESEARKIHGLAEQARENGNFGEALELTDKAILVYQKDNDKLGLSEVMSSRALVFRHLADNTGDTDFLVLAKEASTCSVELARRSGINKALAIPLHTLGKAQADLGEYELAEKSQQEAVDNMLNNPQSIHARAGYLAEIRSHLAVCQYQLGDKSALERIINCIKDLKESDEPKYNKDVWLSGMHMHIADLLKIDDSALAKKHLQKAKEIIDRNPDLKLRKAQWEKLSSSF